VILHKTKLGRIIRAVTYNRDMSSALGVNVPMIYTTVFMLACWLAGLAGTLMAPYSSVFLGMDSTVTIECFIIMVIGGLGSHGGAFIGAIIFGLANSLGILVLPKLAIAFGFIAMAIVLIVRPWGIMGKEL
jgi:branched-subunit amino acid ABC-type transport system permease component